MKYLSCHDGVLQTRLAALSPMAAAAAGFASGLADWDALAPPGGFIRRGVHELLFDAPAGHLPPKFPALALARGTMGEPGAAPLIWCDVERTLYPPAAAAAGIPLDRLYILRPPPAQLLWAIAECLRCKGVAAVMAVLPPRLTRVEVRRLQLAAEQGGVAGLMLRPTGAGSGSDIYAAATRWLVCPAPGERGVQRWNIQLVHGHGGRIGQSILLEKRRAPDFDSSLQRIEAHLVHPSPPVVDRAAAPPSARASA